MSVKGITIYKRKDGRWEARCRKNLLIPETTGFISAYGKSQAEANAKLNQRISHFSINSVFTDETNCFSAYCKKWLDERKIELHRSTYVKYQGIVSKHIIPFLGNIRIDLFSRSDAECFTKFLLVEKELSSKTTKDILVVLNSIYQYAFDELQLSTKPVKIRMPSEKSKKMRVLSPEESQILTKYLTTELDSVKFGLLFCLETGLRVGELCALTWDKISLKEKTVRVEFSMQRLKSENDFQKKTEIFVGPTKSSSSAHTIPLTDFLWEICVKMNPQDPSAYILTGTRNPMEPRSLQNHLKKYTSACQLEDVHCHTLRHTFATRCIEAGFEIKSLSEIMGHANINITLSRYVHPSLNLKRENMRKLDRFLRNLPSNNDNE